jgi:hypothetical protein
MLPGQVICSPYGVRAVHRERPPDDYVVLLAPKDFARPEYSIPLLSRVSQQKGFAAVPSVLSQSRSFQLRARRAVHGWFLRDSDEVM